MNSRYASRVVAPAALLAAACTGSTGAPNAIQVRRSELSVASDTPVAISGAHLAFLADEGTSGLVGTDMNGDGDTTDAIAVVIGMGTQAETNLGVAAKEIAWIGGHLYLVVDEALDGRDWNADSDTVDDVLLHVSTANLSGTPNFVDEMSTLRALPMVTIGSRLFYSSGRTPTQPGESDLFTIFSSAPLSPARVLTRDTTGPLSPHILGKDEGLLLLSLDEVLEGRDLNGDGDAGDLRVLALLDGTSGGVMIRSTDLAIPALSPLRARKRAAHDWDVGFLVSEADQGSTNLDDPALFPPQWKPDQCNGSEDTDATDSVLFYLRFAGWNAAPAQHPPVNTGLVGCRKIAIANGYVATISPESGATDPNGAEGTCDLNFDGDLLDYVVRWVEMRDPSLPLTNAQDIHALRDVPGGTHGLAELGMRFVIEGSESQDNRDFNFDGLRTLDYIGWLLPAGAGNTVTPWDFTHGPQFTTTFGGTWLAESPDRSRLGVAMEEASYGDVGAAGKNLNAHDPPVPGEDQDELDSVPAFPYISGVPPLLVVPGAPVAARRDGPGIVFVYGWAYYRVDEAQDTRDWNADGIRTSSILLRTDLTSRFSAALGTLNALPARPAIEVDLQSSSPFGAAFLADERLLGVIGTDLNGDGDAADFVISYFTF